MQHCHEAREAGSIDRITNVVVRKEQRAKSRKEMRNWPFLAWRRFNTAIESN